MALRLGSAALRLALILSLIGLWFVMHPERSYACSCFPPSPPSSALEEATSVFMGRVVSVERGDSIANPTTVEFDVSTVWKGSNSPARYIMTNTGGASCGYTFHLGGEYLVYSYDGRVSLCSRTSLVSGAEYDRAVLGPGQAVIQIDLTPRLAPRLAVSKLETDGSTPTPVVPKPQTDDSAPTPTASEPQTSSSGCGSAPDTVDLAVVGLMAGAVWLGVRRRG